MSRIGNSVYMSGTKDVQHLHVSNPQSNISLSPFSIVGDFVMRLGYFTDERNYCDRFDDKSTVATCPVFHPPILGPLYHDVYQAVEIAHEFVWSLSLTCQIEYDDAANKCT